MIAGTVDFLRAEPPMQGGEKTFSGCGSSLTTVFAECGLSDLVGLPLVGAGLGEADVGEDAVDEFAGHVGGVLGVVVEGGDGGEDGGSGVGG